jgi:hypothetical protein
MFWKSETDRWVERVAKSIRKQGFAGVPVGDFGREMNWIYTVGLMETFQAPEIIIFDLPLDAAADAVSSIIDGLRTRTDIPAEGVLYEGEGAPPAVWRRVHPSQISGAGWFALAKLYYERQGRPETLEALQLVLPAPDGALPWSEGYPERLRKLQPALYEPAPSALASEAGV